MNDEKSFLGIGWGFPPSFDRNTKGVTMVRDKEDIDQSLEILLSTSLKERVMQPEYGCNLSDYQFESINTSLIGFIRNLVENALLYYEPRIRVEKVDVYDDENFQGIIKISVDYFIRNTNSKFNYVYDFYLLEGTDQK